MREREEDGEREREMGGERRDWVERGGGGGEIERGEDRGRRGEGVR